jgi:hydrogenase maturation protease
VREWARIDGRVRIGARPVDGAIRLTVVIGNTTRLEEGAGREAALMHAMVSTHTVLRVRGGRFVSLADPPEDLRQAAAGCDNAGTWPVPVGEPGSGDVMLSSPIILEDYPRVAEESPGDLFDATEIDEILTLRILTLSDAEKAELRRTDERARELLDRTEALGAEDLMRLHGTLREIRPR